MKLLSIGELAREANVSVHTVRFYESKGLLSETSRTPVGHRQYDGQAVKQLAFISRAKNLGFTLREIQDLLELSTVDRDGCGRVEETAGRTNKRIEIQVAELQRMKGALNKLVGACQTGESTSECPIIEALEGDEEV